MGGVARAHALRGLAGDRGRGGARAPWRVARPGARRSAPWLRRRSRGHRVGHRPADARSGRRVGTDGDVLAVDVSVDALEALRAHATAANISYLVGSAEVLPMTDQSVAALVARPVLIYVESKAEALREAFRVLRNGGRMSVFEPINSRNL